MRESRSPCPASGVSAATPDSYTAMSAIVPSAFENRTGRRYVTGTVSPRLSRSTFSRSSNVFTGRPRTSVTRSNVRSPARYAGESVRCTPITDAGRLGLIPISPTTSTMPSGFLISFSSGTIPTSTYALARKTLSLSSLFGLARTMRCTSANDATRSPSISRIRSPSSSFPSAGWPGSTVPTIAGSDRDAPANTAK